MRSLLRIPLFDLNHPKYMRDEIAVPRIFLRAYRLRFDWTGGIVFVSGPADPRLFQPLLLNRPIPARREDFQRKATALWCRVRTAGKNPCHPFRWRILF